MLTRVGDAFRQSIFQLADGRILGVLVLALIITIVLTGPILLLVLALAAIVEWLPLPSWFGGGGGWIGWSSWLFWTYVMSPLALSIVGTLIDRIVDAVETRHYPTLPKVRHRGLGQVIGYGIRFFALMIGISILAWIIARITGLPAALIFTIASGYMIAREYFETVALRRLDETAAKSATRSDILALWVSGVAVAVMLNVPLLNLVAPLVGVAAFTHLFHSR